MQKKVMVSGIQPSNNITLGNYLGAIKNFVEYQNEYNMYVFVADLHSITKDFDHKKLAENSKSALCWYLALGLDMNKTKIFLQSRVCGHTELAHILLCHTTIGELSRMTQFKDKSSKSSNNTLYIPSGLLTYPTLMAADILIYDADFVIVGSDQKQHIELTRNIGQRMNNKYGEMFNIPEPLIAKDKSARIMDLIKVETKMSKSSANQNGTIFLNDTLDALTKKISKAVTDNFNKIKYDVKNQPGISNLVQIYSSITKMNFREIEEKFKNAENYGIFKKDLIEKLWAFLEPIQKKYELFFNNFAPISVELAKIAEEMSHITSKKLEIVRKKVGFL